MLTYGRSPRNPLGNPAHLNFGKGLGKVGFFSGKCLSDWVISAPVTAGCPENDKIKPNQKLF